MNILNYQNLTLTYNEQEILHHIDSVSYTHLTLPTKA